MRILLISRCLPYPLHHGDRLLLYHVVRELRAHGHHFDLIAFQQKSPNSKVQGPESHARADFGPWTLDFGLESRVDELFEHVETVAEQPRSSFDYLQRLTDRKSVV